MADQPFPHCVKSGQETMLSSQIMGGLLTAVQDHAEMWDLFMELLIELPGGFWSGAGQRAPREKNGVAARRQAIPGQETGAAAAFVFEDGTVRFQRELVAVYDLTAHLQKKTPGRNLGRADRSAQIAQTAFEGIDCRSTRQQRVGNITRCAVFLEKCALGDTGLAAGTLLV